MPGNDTTARGVPRFDDSIAADTIGDGVLLLAAWVNDHPGIQVCTTAERNAYAGADLWEGKTVFNTDTLTLDTYTGATWREGPVINTTVGTVSASAPGDAKGAGASVLAAAADHVHGREAKGAAGDIAASTPGTAAAGGASGKVADAAHAHQREGWGLAGDIAASTPGVAAAIGASTRVADAAHRHAREAWGTLADLQAPGAAAVGGSGRVPDAAHVHPSNINLLAGSVSNVAIPQGGTVDIMDTAALGVGTWMVIVSANVSSNASLPITTMSLVTGTATAAISGLSVATNVQSGGIVLVCEVVVTAAGTLSFLATGGNEAGGYTCKQAGYVALQTH